MRVLTLFRMFNLQISRMDPLRDIDFHHKSFFLTPMHKRKPIHPAGIRTTPD
jgi:hypothetical protein